jgi:hypothetical protein
VGRRSSPSWNNGQVYINSIARDGSATPAVSYDYFGSAPSTITVDNSTSATPVTSGIMEFNSGGQAGNWVFNGDALSSIAADFTATTIQIDGGQTANVTFNNTLNIPPNPTNGGSVFYNNGNGVTLTLAHINISNTPITYNDNTGTHTAGAPFVFNGNTVNTQAPVFFATNGNTIVINTVSTDPGLFTGMLFGNYGDSNMQNGTYVITGALNNNVNGGKQFDFGSGNIVLATSSTGVGPMAFVGAGAGLLQTMLTSGAQTITNQIYAQATSNAEIGGSTANVSTYTNQISAGQGNGQLDLHAAAGGRVIFSGNIAGDNGYTSKDGAGTVVLNSAGGNTFTSYDATTSFEAKTGTTLITNTSGSAFGNSAKLVKVDAGATLGGTGTSTQTVVAVAGTSIIAPGDSGADLGTPTIGTLHLNGGLQAASGVTLAFKINGNSGFAGTNNDLLDFGPGDFAPVGNLTFDFTNLGTIQTSQPGSPNFYKIMQGGGAFDDSGITGYTFNAPAGYVVARYNFDSFAGTFSVDFQIVPEPSTYALMLGGLALLGFCVRRKNRTV